MTSPHPHLHLLQDLYVDFRRIGVFCAPDVVLHPVTQKLRPEVPDVVGVEAVSSHIAGFFDACAGTLRVTVSGMVADDFYGAVLGRLTGRLAGKPFDEPIADLWRFADGRIVEHWEHAYDPAIFG